MRTVALLLLIAGMPAAAADLRLETVRQSLTGTHCRYREYVHGLPSESYVVVPCTESAASIVPDAALPRLRLFGHRVIERNVVEEQPLEPWAYDIDIATGEVVRRIPLFFHGRAAAVFDPNPVVALNDPTLQDLNDSAAAVPVAAYELVELEGVAESGPLRGPHVALVDRQAPHVAPPDVSEPLVFDRSESGFEDTNAYFHIDRNQRYLQSLGYVGARALVPYAIEVDAHGAGGNDNSVFIPALDRPGYGALYFGEGGTDDAEDADLLIHEYMHAVMEWIAPGTFGGPFGGQPRALAEGYSDYWAFSAHFAQRLATGRDPFCLGDWDARCWLDAPSENCAYPPGSDCLRRVDSEKTMADYEPRDAAGVEHRNGLIWASALREIHEQITAIHGVAEGKRIADTIVIESLFTAPPQPTFEAMAHRLLDADQLLYSGRHALIICSAMGTRGILADCGVAPRGDLTLFQSQQRGIPIPDLDSEGVTSSIVITDARAIERLHVRVDIAHPSRGDLRVELITPDGTTLLLHPLSTDRAADIRATYGLTATPADSLDVLRGRSAAGVWQLRVRDLRPRDVGTLLSWSLLISFAGDEPMTTRPAGARSQMIAVVAHVIGVGGTKWLSDLRLANTGLTARTATLIFTRSGQDGKTNFFAIDVPLQAGETIGIDDVVGAAFQTTGSGSLEVVGDVIVMSRTYVDAGDGTLGQQIPPDLDSASAGEPALHAAGLPQLEGQRFNAGVTEVSGGEGTVEVRAGDVTYTFEIAPYSHVQFPLQGTSAAVRVVVGSARVAGYLSQVDTGTGDAMFIPAQSLEPRHGIAPAISARGVNVFWRSDLWLHLPQPSSPSHAAIVYVTHGDSVAATPAEVQLDAVGAHFLRPGTAGAIVYSTAGQPLVHTRITNGTTTQYVPFRPPAGGEHDLLFIETGAGYRTNLGIVAAEPALAEAVVYDASGGEVARLLLGTPGGVAQLALPPGITHGRAAVRFVSGEGRAYASLIDERSGDATYIAGQ